MAKKNPFLAKQEALQRACYTAGVQSGRQQIIDMLSLVLRDPDIMRTRVLGKESLLRVIKGIGEYIDKYQPAFERSDEADYYQAKLDAALAEVYGEGMHDTFLKRYEYAPEFDYKTGRWQK